MAITLKAARVNRKLSQEEAAGQLGVSKYTLSRYERGLSYPNVETVKKIEELYGFSYDEIIFLQ